MPRKVRLNASPRALVVAALAAALLWAGLLAYFPEPDLDLWWHLRTGRLIVDTGAVPRVDAFTYTATGRPWIDHEWLAEVIFARLHQAGGMPALAALRVVGVMLALALGAAAGLVGKPARGARWAAAALGILLAAPLIGVRAFARPHLFTAVLLGLTLLLLRLEGATGRGRWRWFLVPVFALWANLHAGVVLGLLLVALYWAGERFARDDAPRPWRPRLVTGAAMALACLANPYHVHALTYPFLLVGRREVTDLIAELRGSFHPAFAGALFQWALAAGALACGLVLARARPRRAWSLILPALVFGALAVRHVRGLNELAPLLPALLAAHGLPVATARARTAAAAAVLACALLGSAAVARWGVPVGAQPNLRLGGGVEAANVPAAAVRFIREAKPAGRLFNLMGWGSYGIHELWPDRQVYIDGRLDVYPPGFLAGYARLLATGEGWDDAVAAHDIGVVLIDYADPMLAAQGLRRRLREDPQWACVYFADTGLVYARRTPANEALVLRYATPFDPSLRTAASVQAFVAQADAAAIARALDAVAAIAAFAPAEAAPRAVLGQLALAAADAAMRRHDLAAAADALERAAAADPTQPLPLVRLGVVQAQMGRLDLARTYLERAAALAPDDPDVLANLRTLQRVEAQKAAGR